MGLRVALKEVYQRFRWSVPAAGEECLSTGPKSNVQSPMSGNPGSAGVPPATSKAEGRMQNEEEDEENPAARKSYIVNRKSTKGEKTLAAQTSDNTPIAAGANPARNPGLVSGQLSVVSGASRQMPDTQVDASDFWSRVGLAPRGADGQTLPMPSLGSRRTESKR